DPRLTAVTQADLEEQFRFAMQIRERTSEANEAVLLIRGVKSQIDDRVGKANDERIASAGEAFKAALTEVEGEIYQYRNRSNQDPLNYPIKLNNKIAALLNIVDGADSRPTDQSYTVFEELCARLAEQLGRMNQVLDRALPRFNELPGGKGLRQGPGRMTRGGDRGLSRFNGLLGGKRLGPVRRGALASEGGPVADADAAEPKFW